ncbi:MAG: YbaK/EbsC family protein [bacterium]|nr:YbaK/EbsC family protein [bacterium]
MAPFEKIKQFFDDKNIKYQILTHEPVFTSADAAKVRGLSPHQGAKALLLKYNSEYVLAVLPGDLKLDSNKLRKLLDIKDIRFATPEEVEDVMGCRIGACYPIGNIINVKMVLDKKLGENETISFNAGAHAISLIMKYQDYIQATTPQIEDISKE